MIAFLARRLIYMVITLLAVSVVSFVIVQSAPGDFAEIYAARKAAELVGQRIAAKAKEKGIEQVAFDRAGYKYHGRVKALAEAARSGGLKF